MRPCWGDFIEGGKRKAPLLQGGKAHLGRKVLHFICPFGQHIGVYVDCAATDSALE